MVAARNLDRLETAAVEMRSQIPANKTNRLEVLQCNIRKEDQVCHNHTGLCIFLLKFSSHYSGM